MEKLYYEGRPFAFLFIGLKAIAGASDSALMFFSGLLLVGLAAMIMLQRWSSRGYFGLSPARVPSRR